MLAPLLLPLDALAADVPPPPPVRREFRGAWIATVAQIDWPSKAGLTTAQQKAELLELLDQAHALRLNAIVFQVRPACDAFYASEREPWSAYLTGAQGKAPAPFWDPLAFAVAEAHARGMELHAWFNPYRARPAGAPWTRTTAAPSHLSRRRPELVKDYGKVAWCDPGEPEVQEHTLGVILDVVTRYDIDGVHIDDYFYPYKEKNAAGAELPFPDEPSWQAYRQGGGTLARDDWRRDNVDRFVARLYERVKTAKPHVKVGISPFGIGQPGDPPQIAGFDQRTQLYADTRKWLAEGWCDYFAPQLYWPIEKTAQSFPVLLADWLAHNPQGRHLWPGLFTSRVPDPWPVEEIEYQVKIARGFAGAAGTIHFSMKALRGKLGDPKTLAGRLAATVYDEPALVPGCPWLAGGRGESPEAPRKLAASGGALRWEAEGRSVAVWVVQLWDGKAWTTRIVGGGARSVALPAGVRAAAVVGIDRVGRVGTRTQAAIPA